MNEWNVVGVLVTLVGLIAGIGTPILKLNRTISRVCVKLEVFENRIDELWKMFGKDSEKIWDKLDEHTESISAIKTDVEVLKQTE